MRKSNNKKALLIIVISVIALCSVGAFLFYEMQKQESYDQMQITFKEVESVYEVESELDAISFIKSTSSNVEDITYPNIDTTQIGEHVYIFLAYDSFGNQKEFALELNFSDPILPELELSVASVEITEGDAIDLESYVVKAEDPIDGKLEVEIEKPENYKKVGSHEIVYRIQDKNGNKVSAILRLTVKEKPKVEETDTKETNGSENGSNEGSGGQNNSNNQVTNPVSPEPSQTTGNKPANKKFLFSDGYDMQSAQQACQGYLFSFPGYSGACKNLYNGSVPLGQEAVFY
ncbi:hypothetical protein [Breznakia pachnodae]|uniref:Pesticidal crystal protein Cry22Aa Ig-like domain-containing protein n=1 Tax=Breznakia pachnodae TaxID=265178 RepID=A0ABU0E6E5_9FIRM|nr:hypothetical protein [Breznakia pachnodae]MDQ0362478.1 hypothetical protein [Breznakia pachnodae]